MGEEEELRRGHRAQRVRREEETKTYHKTTRAADPELSSGAEAH